MMYKDTVECRIMWYNCKIKGAVEYMVMQHNGKLKAKQGIG